MGSVFDWVERVGPAGYVFEAILASAAGICLLLAFILIRRAYRRNYLRHRNLRTIALRRQLDGIIGGTVPVESWCLNPLDREIVETILLDQLEMASAEQAERLVQCLRSSGLLDLRIYEARHAWGWQRRRALLALGRMGELAGIPALAEALQTDDAETRLIAVRALGRTRLPEAAIPILDRLARNELRLAVPSIQNALLNCCRARPEILVGYVRTAHDDTRPLLARVLGELPTTDLEEDVIALASDPLAEVRASMARALGWARSPLALVALANLSQDQEWFVRLRAVVAMGKLGDVLAIPVLIKTLCDPNRYVRLRSASVLVRFEEHLDEILEMTRRTGDRYALQALLSELERSGILLRLVNSLLDPHRRVRAAQTLLAVLHAGSRRLLLDVLEAHTHWRIRLAVARLLADSGETQLVPELETRLACTHNLRLQRILRWLLRRLAEEPVAAVSSKEA